MKSLKIYRDEKGWIGHKDASQESGLEFGEGTQRLSQFMDHVYVTHKDEITRGEMAKGFAQQLTDLFEDFQEPRRYWKEGGQWFCKDGQMSWDNFFSLMVTMAMWRRYNAIIDMYFKHYLTLTWQRLGFMWNTHYGLTPKKYPIPDWWPLWTLLCFTLRTRVGWLMFPLIWALDLWEIITTSWLLIATSIDKTHTTDDLNQVKKLMIGQEFVWSPVVWIARQLYGGLRMGAAPFSWSPRFEGYGPQAAFEAYFYNDAAPPMDKLSERVIEEYA